MSVVVKQSATELFATLFVCIALLSELLVQRLARGLQHSLLRSEQVSKFGFARSGKLSCIRSEAVQALSMNRCLIGILGVEIGAHFSEMFVVLLNLIPKLMNRFSVLNHAPLKVLSQVLMRIYGLLNAQFCPLVL